VSVQPALEREVRAAPPTPRPAGVIDLGAYRGRTGAAPAVVPPPHPDVDGDGAVVAPVLVPQRLPAPAVIDVGPGLAVDGGELVIRRVRLGSVLRMTFGLSLCTFVVVVGAGALIWLTISTLGVVANLESLAEDLGWTDVSFDGPAMLRAACIGGGILVVAATFLSVVFAEVFNLLSTITGGLRAEVGPPPVSRRQRRKARKAARRATKAGAS
jgi:hypothetical protein